MRTACHPTTLDERDTVIYLIQLGAEVQAEDVWGKSVSQYAYSTRPGTELTPRREGDEYGGYSGTLWDVTLAASGYDIKEFRRDYPRTARYGPKYTRSDFEQLWTGYEHLCPYWNDDIYPRSGGDRDRWSPQSFHGLIDNERTCSMVMYEYL
jgi:hypothetical protein